mgnify:CR=1 FL=1
MSKKFNQDVQKYMKMGYDQNQATALAMGLPPDGPEKPPEPPKPPEPIKPPTQTDATIASKGRGVRSPSATKKKTKLADLRIQREPSVGSALNIGAYA